MKLGSPEHKAQFVNDLLKECYENIWPDEMFILKREEDAGDKRQEIARIDLKIEAKEFKTKNEGDKATFVAEQELKHIEREITERKDRLANYWPKRIESVKRYAESV